MGLSGAERTPFYTVRLDPHSTMRNQKSEEKRVYRDEMIGLRGRICDLLVSMAAGWQRTSRLFSENQRDFHPRA